MVSWSVIFTGNLGGILAIFVAVGQAGTVRHPPSGFQPHTRPPSHPPAAVRRPSSPNPQTSKPIGRPTPPRRCLAPTAGTSNPRDAKPVIYGKRWGRNLKNTHLATHKSPLSPLCYDVFLVFRPSPCISRPPLVLQAALIYSCSPLSKLRYQTVAGRFSCENTLLGTTRVLLYLTSHCWTKESAAASRRVEARLANGNTRVCVKKKRCSLAQTHATGGHCLVRSLITKGTSLHRDPLPTSTCTDWIRVRPPHSLSCAQAMGSADSR